MGGAQKDKKSPCGESDWSFTPASEERVSSRCVGVGDIVVGSVHAEGVGVELVGDDVPVRGSFDVVVRVK